MADIQMRFVKLCIPYVDLLYRRTFYEVKPFSNLDVFLVHFLFGGGLLLGLVFKITIEFWFGRNHICAILNFRDV